ncbi:MAG: iron ABC transporter permease [Pseudomonadota bacterium]
MSEAASTTAEVQAPNTSGVDVTELGRRRRTRGNAIIGGCVALAALGFILSIVVGPLAITIGESTSVLLKNLGLGTAENVSRVKIGVIENIRTPRALLGLFVGASLGASGAVMQGFFRNPLADPGLVGVSAGGAFAAVALIVLGGTALAPLYTMFGVFALPIAAFAGALVTVAAVYRLASIDGRVVVATMLLAGVAADSLAVSGIGYFTFIADDQELRDLTTWTLGSLGGASWGRVWPASLLMLIAIAGFLRLTRPMNCLLLGESDATSLGIDVERVKRMAAVLTALSVGASVAVCGVVSFIGLVVPHLIRLSAGPDHRYVLPGSAFLGAALVLFSDLIARTVAAPAELPLGVVTAAIGAPFFFWLLLRDKRRTAG